MVTVCNPPALIQFRGSAGAAILCETLHQGPRFRSQRVPCIACHPAHNRAMQGDGVLGRPKQKSKGLIREDIPSMRIMTVDLKYL